MNRGNRKQWDALALAGSLGLTTAIVMALAIYGGQRLDGRLGTDPLFTVIGFFVGLGTGVWSFVRWIRQIGRD
ncbi:MAG TPA: AtpZ/AtpI family protein [Bacillota bacterium]|nr:AtpZ/AtpI family protein [Bacillota bacterium]